MLPRQTKARFVAAIRRLLRPVIRQMIAYGVSYPAFDKIVRQLYVEIAERDFALPFKRQTDSRLALVTGISRKEIPALRRQRRADADSVEIEETVVTHAIGRWLGGPPYTDPDGNPRPLPYESDNPKISFARLVRDLGGDIPVRSVLDELLRVGAVTLQPNGDVILSREVHVPPAGGEGKLALLGSDPSEVFTTIMHNIEHDEAPWLQRKVVYDNIGADALESLRHEAQRLGETFLRGANQLLSSHDRDRNPKAAAGKRTRVVLGVYYFQEEHTKTPPDETDGAPPAPPGRIRRSP